MIAEVALSFPTVVFTVLVGVSLGYWLLSLLSGVGGDLDLDLDTDLDLDGGDLDLDGDAGADGGGLGALLHGLHLTGVPPAIVLSVTATLGWFVSYAVALLTDLDASGPVGIALGAALILVAAVLGLLGASVVARPLARLFLTPRAVTNASLVGRRCVIRTGTVTAEFGQAELRAPDGTEHVVQVRTLHDEGLVRGDAALLFDYDAERGVFHVTSLAALDDPSPS